jgi:signal transduction histidine kinase/ABC-type uncharacterized transport system substrate-binding protein
VIALICIAFLLSVLSDRTFGLTMDQGRQSAELSSEQHAEQSAERNKHIRVLLICSYNAEFITYPEQIAGIRSVMNYETYEIDVEFMDTKKFNSKEDIAYFYESLKRKLDRLEAYDVVLIADDYALSFAMDNRENLFPQIPIVFLGINDLDKAHKAYESGYFTGVVENVSMYETLEVASKLHPEANRVIAIVDPTQSGQGDLKSFYSIKSQFETLEFVEVSLAKYSFSDYAQALSKLNETDIILLLSAYEDKEGTKKNFFESLKLIVNSTQAPIYHLWYHGLGQGIIGGKVISHREQGKKAAEMALLLLEGKPLASVELCEASPNKFIFDYEVLASKGISPEKLPKDSIILNKPENTYQHIWNISLGVIASLSVVIAFMIIVIRFRKKSQEAIERMNRELAEMNALLEEEIQEKIESEEQAFEAKNEAEEANKAKSYFLANMSHEIRTPLNGVIGLTDLILTDDLTLEQRDNLQLIKSSSKSLLAIINDIMDYTKIERGNVYIEQNDFEIRRIIEEVVQLFAINLKDKELEIRLSVDKDVPKFILGDAMKTKQIVSNLIGNAVKFTHEGVISIDVGIADQTDVQLNLRLNIADTGIGINKAFSDKVFLRFYQQDMSYKKEHQGSGLGLAITKGLVDAMKGEISFKSEEGVGTTFL